MKRSISSRIRIAALAGAMLTALMPAFAWEPSKTVEFIVPAGTGGGADQMARFIQGVVAKHKLMKVPMVVVNEGGGAGAEGFLDVKDDKGDGHKLDHHAVEPLHHAARHGRAVQLEGPHAGRDDGARRVRALGARRHAVQDVQGLHRRDQGGGAQQVQDGRHRAPSRRTRSSPANIEKQTGVKFIYIPYKGGGEVAVQLVGKHIDSTVNNPIEAVAQWRAGSLRPLCVFDAQRMPYKEKVTKDMSWYDIPTCKEQGLNVEYLMLRGIFMPGGVDARHGQVLRRRARQGARDARTGRSSSEEGGVQHRAT